MLNPGTSSGNTLKTYITEGHAMSESKGKDIQRIEQCCAFLFTTNHFPTWMDPDERRYYVVEMDHAGHAAGPEGAEFGAFVGRLLQHYSDPRNVAKLYNALMKHPMPNSFNPMSLNTAAIDTRIMREITGASSEALLDQISEFLNENNLVAVSQAHLIQTLVRETKVSLNRLRHLLRDLGWAQQSVKWGGKDYVRVLYIRSGYGIDRGEIIGPDNFRHKMEEAGVKADGKLVKEEEIVR